MIFGQIESGYLINLPERTDRLRTAREEIARATWERQFHILNACRFTEAKGFESPAERGCFHSHLACLRLAARSGENVLVLEDDIAFAPSLPRLHESVAEELRQPWGIVYFGHEDTGDIERAARHTRSAILVKRPCRVIGAHFYAVHRSIVGPLIQFLETLLTRRAGDPKGGPMPFDGALTTFLDRNPAVPALIAVPKLGWQRPSRSDLTPSLLDKIPALRPAITVGRQLKHFFGSL